MGNIVTSVMHVHCGDLISHINAKQQQKKEDENVAVISMAKFLV